MSALPSTITTTKAFDMHYRPAHPEMGKLAANAMRVRVSLFNRHARKPDVSHITPVHFNEVSASMRASKKSESHIRHVLRATKKLLTFLHENGFLPDGRHRDQFAATRGRNMKDVFNAYVRENILKPRTIEQYEVSVYQLLHFAGEHPLCAELDESLLSDFVRWYHQRGASAVTVRRKRRHLLTLWNYAADQGWAIYPRSRKVPQPSEPRRVPTSWTIDELRRIEAACLRAKRPSGDWNGLHWLALVKTLYDTCHRVWAIVQTPMARLADRHIAGRSRDHQDRT